MGRNLWISSSAPGVCATAAVAAALAGKPVGEPPVTTLERAWAREADFAADPALHATELQTIVIDLEDRNSRRSRGRVQTNTVRFLIEERRDFAFCIGADDHTCYDCA